MVTEGQRWLVSEVQQRSLNYARKRYGWSNYRVRQEHKRAMEAVTAALWIEGRNTPESFYFLERSGKGSITGVDAIRGVRQ